MKLLLLSILALSAPAQAETPWERYLDEPNGTNAAAVSSITYTVPMREVYSSDDLEILKLQVLSADPAAFRLTHRLYRQADGGLAEELAAILASVVRPHPEFFLYQVAQLDPSCASFNVQVPGLEYVDRRTAQEYERKMRRQALASVSNPELDPVRSICLAKLDPTE